MRILIFLTYIKTKTDSQDVNIINIIIFLI